MQRSSFGVTRGGKVAPCWFQLVFLVVAISRRALVFLYTLAKEGVVLRGGTRSAPSLLESVDPETQAGKDIETPATIQVRSFPPPRGPRPLQAVGLKLDGPKVSPARYPDLTRTVRTQLLRRRQLGLGPGLGLSQPSTAAASPAPGPGPPSSRAASQGSPAWTMSVRVYSGCLMLVIQFWYQYRTQRAADPGPALNGLTPMQAIAEEESVAASLHSLQPDLDTSSLEESGPHSAPPDEEAAAAVAGVGFGIVAESEEAAAAGPEETVLAVAATGDLGGLVSLSEILQLLPEDLRESITSAHDMTGADAPIRILGADLPYLLAPEAPRSTSALVAVHLALAPSMPQPETLEEARRVFQCVAWQGPDEEPPQLLTMLSWEISSRTRPGQRQRGAGTGLGGGRTDADAPAVAPGGVGLGVAPLRLVEVRQVEEMGEEGAGEAPASELEVAAAGAAWTAEAAEGPGPGFDSEEGVPSVGEGSQGSALSGSGSEGVGASGPRGSSTSIEIGGLPALRMRARGGGGAVENVPGTPLTATGVSTSNHILGGPGTVPTPQSLLTTPLDMYEHRGGSGTPGPKRIQKRASFQPGPPGPGPGGAVGQGSLLEDTLDLAPSPGTGEGSGAHAGEAGSTQWESESAALPPPPVPDTPQPPQPGRELCAAGQPQTAVEVRMLVEVPVVVRGIRGDAGPGTEPGPAPGPSPLCSLVHLGVECGETGASCLPLSIPVLPWSLASEIPGGEDGEEILADMVALVSMREGGVEGSDPFLLRVVRHLEEYAVGTGKVHLADFCASLTTPPPTATATGPSMGQEDPQLQPAAAGDRGSSDRIRGWLWPRRLPVLTSGAGTGGLVAGGGGDAAPAFLDKDQLDQGDSEPDKRRRARYVFLEVLPSVARNVLAFLLLLWLVKWFLEVGPGSPSLPWPGPAEAVPAAPEEVPAVGT